jgi:hypothetical protein
MAPTEYEAIDTQDGFLGIKLPDGVYWIIAHPDRPGLPPVKSVELSTTTIASGDADRFLQLWLVRYEDGRTGDCGCSVVRAHPDAEHAKHVEHMADIKRRFATE